MTDENNATPLHAMPLKRWHPILRWTLLVGTIPALVALFFLVGPYVEWHGMRLVGYHYGVYVNNATTICPTVVTSVESSNGISTLVLDDGRRVLVSDNNTDYISFNLAKSQNYIYIDPATLVIYNRLPVERCGFSNPNRCQHITIPLFPTELRSHMQHELTTAWKILPPAQ